jgi:MFS family permease
LLEHLAAGWIVAAYMLATAIVTALDGKLGDLFGRKVMLQEAIALFLLGSALCGLGDTAGFSMELQNTSSRAPKITRTGFVEAVCRRSMPR